MALSINTNTSASAAMRYISQSTTALGKTFERLASGQRVKSASDDAAGLSIASKMGGQIRSFNQAVRNSNDAVSLLQVADGALLETSTSLQRIRELTTQAANDSYTSTDRANIQVEVNQLISEIDRIAKTTNFNGVSLLDGTYSAGKKIQVGADYNAAGLHAVTISILNAKASGLGLATTAGVASILITGNSASGVAQQLTKIDNAVNSIGTIRTKLGALQNRFQAVMNNLTNMSEGIAAAQSRIIDADIATETANLTRNAILQQAGMAVLAQANQQPLLALQLLK
ncbi:MAG: flagellin FliC [Magnetococcales bacterium]|nr:flagellin FliC [Magnetococcales bacterium]